MNLKTLSLCLMFLLVLSMPVYSYDPWIVEDNALGQALESLDQLDLAIEKATAGRSAHPDFLADLVSLSAAIREALTHASQTESWGDYARYNQRITINVAGEWNIKANISRGTLSLKQEGNIITGTVLANPIVNGAILPDGSIYFERDMGGIGYQYYTGTLDAAGQKIVGTFDCPYSGTTKTPWSAERK